MAVHTFCRICESLCGLEVETRDGRVVEIRPDALRHPMKRVGSAWHRVSWEEALGGIGASVRRLREEQGPDSVAMYVGRAAGPQAAESGSGIAEAADR